jgi:hypothetical protein
MTGVTVEGRRRAASTAMGSRPCGSSAAAAAAGGRDAPATREPAMPRRRADAVGTPAIGMQPRCSVSTLLAQLLSNPMREMEHRPDHDQHRGANGSKKDMDPENHAIPDTGYLAVPDADGKKRRRQLLVASGCILSECCGEAGLERCGGGGGGQWRRRDRGGLVLGAKAKTRLSLGATQARSYASGWPLVRPPGGRHPHALVPPSRAAAPTRRGPASAIRSPRPLSPLASRHGRQPGPVPGQLHGEASRRPSAVRRSNATRDSALT